MQKPSFYQLSYQALSDILKEQKLPPSGAPLLFNWHYKKSRTTPCLQNLANASIHFLKESFDFFLPNIVTCLESSDGTVKFLVEFSDGERAEMVLIPFQGKYTLCLSSQVGCALNCKFCYTATAGFTRNLATEEIVGQIVVAKNWLNTWRPKDNKLLNVVFMGQGEPLDNFDAVAAACNIMLTKNGLSIAPHKITISTAGFLPGIRRFKQDMPPVNIALSLHSPFNDERSQLMPLNRVYPLAELLPLLEIIPEGKNRFVTYEYLLIHNINDTEKHAHALGQMLEGKKAYINLIPFNPFPGSSLQPSSPQQIINFKSIVEGYYIPTTLRSTKGQDILAACGQLKNQRDTIKTSGK